MIEIANNQCYSIYVEPSKNRVYLTLIGFWASPATVPNYLDDITKMSLHVKEGYTILSDLSQMKAPSADIGNIHRKAQEICVAAGLGKTAELLPGIKPVEKKVIDRYSKDSGMNKKVFKSKADAEKWLDETSWQ
ncbi:MAG: hypothetical protein GY757_14835 [bacterium]|nr:hypothetical protein [bacterium]